MKNVLPVSLASVLFAVLALQFGAAQAQIDPYKPRLNPAADIGNPGVPQQGICIGVGCLRLKPDHNNVVQPAAATPLNCPGSPPGGDLPPGPCKNVPAAR